MKASIRLAAIMRIPCTFVFTHDSIGVGEDGPTHQPIEQLATLRATPNINVVRPAGLQRDRAAWRFALNATETPTALALSRQGVPSGTRPACPTTRSSAAPTCCTRREGGDPELILMASGTEVHIAYDAAKLLDADGVKVRLVSMPCLDRFAEQDQSYRDSVLPPAVRARVAVEAASPLGWHRWVGDARRRRGDGGLRRLRARRSPLQALRLHGRGRGRARATSAEPTDMIDHRRPA